MKKILLFIILLFYIVSNSLAQDTEFWFVAPDASDRFGDSPVFLVISNPTEKPATVEVRINGGTLVGGAPYTIPASHAERIEWNVDTGVRTLIENPMYEAGSVTKKGIQILVTDGEGVTAYYQVDNPSSKDIFTLKGTHALGDEFYIPMMYDSYYPIKWNSYAQIDIVAAEDCEITFTPTKDCMYRADVLSPYLANTPHNITLAKGETFKLIEKVDSIVDEKGSGLAGTKITSNTPNSIAVTVTEDAADSNGAQDIIGDQIVPTAYTGTRYIVIKGHTGMGQSTTDRLYFTASTEATTVTVYGDGGWPTQTVTLSGAGDTKVVDIGNDSGSGFPNVVYIESGAPVYCYHVSGVGKELGSALIPSMFSIAQQQLAFYASDMSGNGVDINDILLVFRENSEDYFEISKDGEAFEKLSPLTTLTPNSIPGPVSGTVTWHCAKVSLPDGYRNDNMITIRNSESPFSLGYFNGDAGTSSYGYLSSFAPWEFPQDTIWRCTNNPNPTILKGGYAMTYRWTLPNGSIESTSNIQATLPGKYILEMGQGSKTATDSIWIVDMEFNASITRESTNSLMIDVPQKFSVDTKGETIAGLSYQWTLEGASPAISTAASPTVTWNSGGQKTVTLNLSVSRGSGVNEIICDTTLVMNLFVGEPIPIPPTPHRVTIPEVEGLKTFPQAGELWLENNASLSLTLWVEDTHDRSEIHLVVNGDTVRTFTNELRSTSVTYSHRFEQVTGAMDIEFHGVKRNSPMGIANINNLTKVYAQNGHLFVESPKVAELAVYGMDGKLYAQRRINEGLTQITLPAGTYVVRIGEESWKVVVKDR